MKRVLVTDKASSDMQKQEKELYQ